MKPSNLWLTLTVLSVFATIITLVLGGLAAFAFFQDTVRQGKATSFFDAWLESQKAFVLLSFGGVVLGAVTFISYRRYAKSLPKDK